MGFYTRVFRCFVFHVVGHDPSLETGVSCMAMLRCALWVKHADLCVTVAGAISRKDQLRNLPPAAVVFWSLIRGAYRRLVKTEKVFSDPAWRNVDGWADNYEGVRQRRLLLEEWLRGRGGRRLPKRLPSWPVTRPSSMFA